jgi:hypothetical protein
MAYRECPIQHTDPGHTNPRARTPAPTVPTTIEGRRNLSSARTSRVSRVTPAWPPAPARYPAGQRARLKAPRQRHGDGMEKRVRPDACAGRNLRLSLAPHHSKNGSATHAATRWLMAPGQPPRGSPTSAANVARASRRIWRRWTLCTAASRLGLRKAAQVWQLVPPICSTRTADTPLGMPMRSDPGRSSPASAAALQGQSSRGKPQRCGLIPLPPRCHEDQKGLTAFRRSGP